MDVFPTFFIVLWIIMCIFVAEINTFVLHMNPRHKFKPQISALCLLLLAVLFVACEADTVPFNLPPTLTVSEATDIYRKGATISGTYTKANENVGVETFGLLYATNSLLGDADTIFATPDQKRWGEYTIKLSNLTPSTTYYYATFTTSGNSIVNSDIKQFRTADNSAPQLGELTISDVTGYSFEVSSELLDDGGSDISLRGFLIRKAPTDITDLNIQDTQFNLGDDVKDFSTTITGLEENTRYAVRAYAVSSAGLGYGEIRYVVTGQVYIPALTAVSANITDKAGELNVSSSVTNTELPILERGFVYSTESSEPTINNNKVVATGSNTSFSATLKGLPSDVPVYIRAYAYTTDVVGYSETYTYVASEWVVLPEVSGITASSHGEDKDDQLRVSAEIIRQGSYSIIDGGFVFSTESSEPVVGKNQYMNLTLHSNVSFSTTISGLLQDRTNYIRAYVHTSAGYFYGDVFEYRQSDWPVLTTLDATNVWENTARLNATLERRYSSIEECGFLGSPTNSAPSFSDSIIIANAAANALSAYLDELTPDTKYYYRPFVRHAKGVTYGVTSSFTTTRVKVEHETYDEDNVIR